MRRLRWSRKGKRKVNLRQRAIVVRDEIILRAGNYALPVLLVAMSLGCARSPQLAPPQIAPPTRMETLEDATKALERNYASAYRIKASGEIRVRPTEQDNWRPADFLLVLERPDKVRMRGYRPLVSNLFEFISNGIECWLHIPSERTAYLSDCGALHSGREDLAVSAEAIVSAVLVVSDFDTLESRQARFQREGDIVRIVFEETASRREIWVDPASGLATRQFITNEDDTLEADILYKEHADFDGAALPVEVEVELPRIGSSMSLSIREVELLPKITPGTFEFSPPQNTSVFVPDAEQPGAK